MPSFSFQVSKDQHARIRSGAVPAPLAAVGMAKFTVLDAARYALVVYLAQPAALQDAARTAGVTEWTQVKAVMAPELHAKLVARTLAEGRTKASVMRAAIDLAYPPHR